MCYSRDLKPRTSHSCPLPGCLQGRKEQLAEWPLTFPDAEVPGDLVQGCGIGREVVTRKTQRPDSSATPSWY